MNKGILSHLFGLVLAITVISMVIGFSFTSFWMSLETDDTIKRCEEKLDEISDRVDDCEAQIFEMMIQEGYIEWEMEGAV